MGRSLMARKAGIDLDDVRAAAVEIADRAGYDGLTVAAVARELGIRSPSLYAHVDGLSGLRRLVAVEGAHRIAESLADAAGGTSGEHALRAFAVAYRAFAHRHPGLYDAVQADAPSPDENPALAAALAEPVHLVAAALSDLDLPPERHVHLIRGIRSALHGFVDLERRGGFGLPEDIDTSFTALTDLILAGLVPA